VGQLREIFKVINGEAQLAKAASIPSGAYWITVRPNNPGTDGHAVLIKPSSDGAFRVVGGAGGKPNYLQLTGVRGEEDYAQREGAEARQEKKQGQRKRDRESGFSQSEAAAVQQLRPTAQQASNDFIKHVAGPWIGSPARWTSSYPFGQGRGRLLIRQVLPAEPFCRSSSTAATHAAATPDGREQAGGERRCPAGGEAVHAAAL